MSYAGRIVSIKPTAGQTVPVNAIGGADLAPTGAYSLADTGSGVMAWRVSASTSMPLAGGRTVSMIGGSGDPGVVLAMMVRESVTGTGVSNLRLSAYGNSGDPSGTGAQLLRVGDGVVTGAWSSNQAPTMAGVVHSTLTCWVLKVYANEAGDGLDRLRVWKGKSGRVGSTPDSVHVGANLSGVTINNILWAASGGHVEDHVREDFWINGEPTDAECAALADAGFSSVAAYDAILAVDSVAPTITGPTGAPGDASISITIAENTTDLGVWLSNESCTWGVSGVDAAKVAIGSGTGSGLLIAPPNFENPQDVGNDNVLNFNITATDAALNVRSQAVVLTVINSNESPVFVGPSIGLVSGVVGSAISPINLAPKWTDPDTGDAGTYTKTGTWPAGPDLTSAGVLQGTIPAVDGVYSGATVTRTDGNGVAAVSNAFNFEATPVPPTYYSATWGGFALNTGSGKRAPGTVFNWWAFHNAVIGDNPAGLTVASGSGVLNGAGEAVVATFPLPGTWEVQTRFPNDAGDATQKGTARTTVTAA